MELKILNLEGKPTTKTIKLEEEIFKNQPNNHVVYLNVKQYLANKRQGTHKAKERGEVVGSTRKIKKQKGTGTARAGSIKNPLFKGGGRVFGPRPRNYGVKLNLKTKRLARKSALSFKIQEKNVIAIEKLDFKEPKTKLMVDLLKKLKIEDKKILIVLNELNKNVTLSSRNLKKVKILNAFDLNTYSILDSEKILFEEDSFPKIKDLLCK